MPVIGRLDEQVESLLISPLDSDRRPAKATRETPVEERALQRDSAQIASEVDNSEANRVKPGELPVWLL